MVALLQAYARSSKAIEPNDTLVTDLKIMKTAIGVLLNASMGFGVYTYHLQTTNSKLK